LAPFSSGLEMTAWFTGACGTGEKNAVARSEMQISSVNLGEEYFHPVNGEKNAVARSD
jgi:hypothetical protein